MNALQLFIASKPDGFIAREDLPALIALDRLCPLLVRCGACRFTCAAQDADHLIRCVQSVGDYVRDVSFPVGAQDRAAHWRPEPTPARPAQQSPAAWSISRNSHPAPKRREEGVDWIATGNFDGFACGSDADPGL